MRLSEDKSGIENQFFRWITELATHYHRKNYRLAASIEITAVHLSRLLAGEKPSLDLIEKVERLHLMNFPESHSRSIMLSEAAWEKLDIMSDNARVTPQKLMEETLLRYGTSTCRELIIETGKPWLFEVPNSEPPSAEKRILDAAKAEFDERPAQPPLRAIDAPNAPTSPPKPKTGERRSVRRSPAKSIPVEQEDERD